MLLVVRLQSSKRGKTEVLLSDGRTVVVPNGTEWGSEVPAEDIVEVSGSWCHKSLVKQKKSKDYDLQRDLSGYDPKVELNQIRQFVFVMFREVMGRKPFSSDEFEEVVSYCVEACVRRHIYEKYSPSFPGSYSGYLKSVIFNLLRDYRRKYSSFINSPFSLNKPIGEDEEEFIDFVSDTGIGVCEYVEHKILLEKLSACVTRLDEVGTGLPGFTYADLFDLMVNGESLDDYLKGFKYPRQLLDEYVSNFKEQLKEEVYGVWMVA